MAKIRNFEIDFKIDVDNQDIEKAYDSFIKLNKAMKDKTGVDNLETLNKLVELLNRNFKNVDVTSPFKAIFSAIGSGDYANAVSKINDLYIRFSSLQDLLSEDVKVKLPLLPGSDIDRLLDGVGTGLQSSRDTKNKEQFTKELEEFIKNAAKEAGRAIKEEADAARDAAEAFDEAADSKEKFAKANEKAADSAKKTKKATEDESKTVTDKPKKTGKLKKGEGEDTSKKSTPAIPAVSSEPTSKSTKTQEKEEEEFEKKRKKAVADIKKKYSELEDFYKQKGPKKSQNILLLKKQLETGEYGDETEEAIKGRLEDAQKQVDSITNAIKELKETFGDSIPTEILDRERKHNQLIAKTTSAVNQQVLSLKHIREAREAAAEAARKEAEEAAKAQAEEAAKTSPSTEVSPSSKPSTPQTQTEVPVKKETPVQVEESHVLTKEEKIKALEKEYDEIIKEIEQAAEQSEQAYATAFKKHVNRLNGILGEFKGLGVSVKQRNQFAAGPNNILKFKEIRPQLQQRDAQREQVKSFTDPIIETYKSLKEVTEEIFSKRDSGQLFSSETIEESVALLQKRLDLEKQLEEQEKAAAKRMRLSGPQLLYNKNKNPFTSASLISARESVPEMTKSVFYEIDSQVRNIEGSKKLLDYKVQQLIDVRDSLSKQEDIKSYLEAYKKEAIKIAEFREEIRQVAPEKIEELFGEDSALNPLGFIKQIDSETGSALADIVRQMSTLYDQIIQLDEGYKQLVADAEALDDAQKDTTKEGKFDPGAATASGVDEIAGRQERNKGLAEQADSLKKEEKEEEEEEEEEKKKIVEVDAQKQNEYLKQRVAILASILELEKHLLEIEKQLGLKKSEGFLSGISSRGAVEEYTKELRKGRGLETDPRKVDIEEIASLPTTDTSQVSEDIEKTAENVERLGDAVEGTTDTIKDTQAQTEGLTTGIEETGETGEIAGERTEEGAKKATAAINSEKEAVEGLGEALNGLPQSTPTETPIQETPVQTETSSHIESSPTESSSPIEEQKEVVEEKVDEVEAEAQKKITDIIQQFDSLKELFVKRRIGKAKARLNHELPLGTISKSFLEQITQQEDSIKELINSIYGDKEIPQAILEAQQAYASFVQEQIEAAEIEYKDEFAKEIEQTKKDAEGKSKKTKKKGKLKGIVASSDDASSTSSYSSETIEDSERLVENADQLTKNTEQVADNTAKVNEEYREASSVLSKVDLDSEEFKSILSASDDFKRVFPEIARLLNNLIDIIPQFKGIDVPEEVRDSYLSALSNQEYFDYYSEIGSTIAGAGSYKTGDTDSGYTENNSEMKKRLAQRIIILKALIESADEKETRIVEWQKALDGLIYKYLEREGDYKYLSSTISRKKYKIDPSVRDSLKKQIESLKVQLKSDDDAILAMEKYWDDQKEIGLEEDNIQLGFQFTNIRKAIKEQVRSIKGSPASVTAFFPPNPSQSKYAIPQELDGNLIIQELFEAIRAELISQIPTVKENLEERVREITKQLRTGIIKQTKPVAPVEPTPSAPITIEDVTAKVFGRAKEKGTPITISETKPESKIDTGKKSAEGIKEEGTAADSAIVSFENLAEAKRAFAEANGLVLDSAKDSADGIKNEGLSLGDLARTLKIAAENISSFKTDGLNVKSSVQDLNTLVAKIDELISSLGDLRDAKEEVTKKDELESSLLNSLKEISVQLKAISESWGATFTELKDTVHSTATDVTKSVQVMSNASKTATQDALDSAKAILEGEGGKKKGPQKSEAEKLVADYERISGKILNLQSRISQASGKESITDSQAILLESTFKDLLEEREKILDQLKKQGSSFTDELKAEVSAMDESVKEFQEKLDDIVNKNRAKKAKAKLAERRTSTIDELKGYLTNHSDLKDSTLGEETGETLATRIESLRRSASNIRSESGLDKVIEDFEQLKIQVKGYEEEVRKAEQAAKAFKSKQKGLKQSLEEFLGSNSDMDSTFLGRFNSLISDIDSAKTVEELDKIRVSLAGVKSEYSDFKSLISKKQSFKQSLEEFFASNQNMGEEYKTRFNAFIDAIDSAKTAEQIDQLKVSLAGLKSEYSDFKSLESKKQSFGQGINDYLASQSDLTEEQQGIFTALKDKASQAESIDAIKELQTEFVEAKKKVNDLRSELQSFNNEKKSLRTRVTDFQNINKGDISLFGFDERVTDLIGSIDSSSAGTNLDAFRKQLQDIQNELKEAKRVRAEAEAEFKRSQSSLLSFYDSSKNKYGSYISSDKTAEFDALRDTIANVKYGDGTNLDTLKAQLEGIVEPARKAKEAIDSLEKSRKSLLGKVDTYAIQNGFNLEDTESKDDAVIKLQQLRKDIENASSDRGLISLKANFDEIKESIKQAQQEAERFSKDIITLRDDANSFMRENSGIISQNDMYSNVKDYILEGINNASSTEDLAHYRDILKEFEESVKNTETQGLKNATEAVKELTSNYKEYLTVLTQLEGIKGTDLEPVLKDTLERRLEGLAKVIGIVTGKIPDLVEFRKIITDIYAGQGLDAKDIKIAPKIADSTNELNGMRKQMVLGLLNEYGKLEEDAQKYATRVKLQTNAGENPLGVNPRDQAKLTEIEQRREAIKKAFLVLLTKELELDSEIAAKIQDIAGEEQRVSQQQSQVVRDTLGNKLFKQVNLLGGIEGTYNDDGEYAQVSAFKEKIADLKAEAEELQTVLSTLDPTDKDAFVGYNERLTEFTQKVKEARKELDGLRLVSPNKLAANMQDWLNKILESVPLMLKNYRDILKLLMQTKTAWLRKMLTLLPMLGNK